MDEAWNAAHDIEKVLHWEFEYIRAALDRDDKDRVRSELRDAEKKLKDVAHRLHLLEGKFGG